MDNKTEDITEAERSKRRREKNRISTEHSNIINNPCAKEYKMATECSLRNIDDKDQCKAYFANYRACMEFWTKIKAQRRAERIRPLLPPPEEREKILMEHRNKAKS